MVLNIIKALILDDLLAFLDFWYLHFPKNLIRNYFDRIYSLDKTLGFKVNLRNLTKPLYGDYSLIGYSIAFPYRLIKILIAGFVYLFLAFFYLLFLFIWLVLPIFLLIYGVLFSK